MVSLELYRQGKQPFNFAGILSYMSQENILKPCLFESHP